MGDHGPTEFDLKNRFHEWCTHSDLMAYENSMWEQWSSDGKQRTYESQRKAMDRKIRRNLRAENKDDHDEDQRRQNRLEPIKSTRTRRRWALGATEQGGQEVEDVENMMDFLALAASGNTKNMLSLSTVLQNVACILNKT